MKLKNDMNVSPSAPNAIGYETKKSLSEKYSRHFTVFTPTFNRAKLLPALYESLCSQIYKDFEWLVVDGGSDESESLIEKWRVQADFPIRYIRQRTSGLHGAYNEGAFLAHGELFLTMHSDDSCLPETLVRFEESWNKIPVADRSRYSGIWARCLDQSGKMIGRSMGVGWLDSTYQEIMFKHGLRGEMFPMIRTDVMREFPFPMIAGARFVPEGVIWSAVGVKYRTIVIDIPLRKYASIDEAAGSTDKLTDPGVLTKNAPSIILYYRTTLLRDIYWARFAPLTFLRIAAAYTYYSLLGNVRIHDQIRGLPLVARLLWCLAFPIGAAKYCRMQWGAKISSNKKKISSNEK